eukprot:gene10411-9174_t
MRPISGAVAALAVLAEAQPGMKHRMMESKDMNISLVGLAPPRN